MEYIAHRKENGNYQLLLDHLTGVANMAEYFAADFLAEDFGRCVGMLHDIGKYSNRFQRYIRGEEKLKRGDVDHSSAGAIEAYHMSANAIGLIMSYCISGHHSGLLDGGSKYDDNESAATLWGRLNKEVEDYSSYTNEIQISDKPQKPLISLITESINEKGNFSLSFFIRMVFSCLVDADFLDTEKYMTDGMQYRDAGEDIHSLKKKLDSFLNKNGYLKGEKGINKYRSDILKECIEEGKGDEKFYTLTVPTGGGKTISSLAFALERAEKASKKRVIYVIPYCSIIEQTVDIFRHIFGENNVLAAYSNADYDDENLRLSADNWNKPIVVTTSVQFFESFYSNRTSACRKLHNVADSVIIFDEAQLLPEFRLKPCIRVIEELGVNYGCVAVLCTATQPS
ncbi:MAG: CRISPR-associated endonuclease Cas3'', partial [Lachnospiraceae bacterium]|nr:CRISPR-associated endonuclease Cas3'' [Lachnospiraceae bacterium]